uniref:Uncharacterized protein n=1 Tax=Anguilla anguilla TaxID=7936 RepID=A0A0E9SKB2_ANGAN
MFLITAYVLTIGSQPLSFAVLCEQCILVLPQHPPNLRGAPVCSIFIVLCAIGDR